MCVYVSFTVAVRTRVTRCFVILVACCFAADVGFGVDVCAGFVFMIAIYAGFTCRIMRLLCAWCWC